MSHCGEASVKCDKKVCDFCPIITPLDYNTYFDPLIAGGKKGQEKKRWSFTSHILEWQISELCDSLTGAKSDISRYFSSLLLFFTYFLKTKFIKI